MSELPKFGFGGQGSAAPNAEKSPSLFGGASSNAGTPTTSGPGSGLFGSTPASAGPGGGTFGGTSGGASLFGSKPATPAGGSGFGFGQTTTSGSEAQKPLFGAVGSSGGGGFGTTQATSGEQPKSAPSGVSNFSSFGFGGNKAASTPASQPSTAPSLFGASGADTSNIFGSKKRTAMEPPQSAPAGGTAGSNWGFGQQNQSTASLFGGAANNAPPSNQSGGGLFGSTPAAGAAGGSTTPQPNKSGPPLSFSTTPAGNPPANASLFSNLGNKMNENNQPAASNGGGAKSLFAPQNTESKPAGQLSFGTSNATPSSQPSDNQQPASAPTTGQPPAQSIFAGATPSANQPGNTSNIFGNLGKKPDAQPTSAPAGQSLFSTLGQKPSAADGAASSQPVATTKPASPFGGGGLFGAQTTSSGTSQPTATTTAGGTSSGAGLFGSTPSSTAGGTSGGLFGAPTAQPTTSGAGTTSTAAPSSTATAAPTAAGTSGASVFGGGASTTGLGAGGASTAGPAPPAQSRLAAKSMDEILTMWSTSLASHQKSFQTLAGQVSGWDRMLVENSSKISTLYGRCFQAERDCSEVERQLSGVENAQFELDNMLNRYEAEVDRLLDTAGMGDNGPGVSGVDAERERTYKTAENCSTRLTEMSHSLTDMIEEINIASGKLGNANNNKPAQNAAEDPLAQIVRVLNGHLAQLQEIDSGAAALQGKVVAAQREARDLQGRPGEGSGNGRTGGWVDDFGRSYLGRR